MKQNRLIDATNNSKFILPIIGTLAFAFAVFHYAMFAGGTLLFELMNKLPELNEYFNHLNLFSNITVTIVFFLWIKFVERRSISSMGLFKENKKNALKGFIFGAAVFVAIILVMSVLGLIKFKENLLSFSSIVQVIIILPFWLIQASSEEIFARGFVLPLVSKKSNKIIGIVVSTLAFLIIHLGNRGLTLFAIINIVLVSVLLGIYSLYTEDIWGAIGFHTAWNYVQGSILGLSVSGGIPFTQRLMTLKSEGAELLSGGKFGVEASIFTSIGLLLATMYIFHKYSKKANQ